MRQEKEGLNVFSELVETEMINCLIPYYETFHNLLLLCSYFKCFIRFTHHCSF